jgi:hypothetical protein
MMALLIIPVLADQKSVFPWAARELFADGHSPHKAAYLQPPWFALRSCVYLGLTSVLAWPLSSGRWPGLDRKQALSAGGLVAYFAVMLFAASDWILSLEPKFYSSMAVVELATSQFLPALAWMIFVALTFDLCGGIWDREKQQRDLGNLLLAFVIFSAYISFSQFLIIWSGNLPREIGWYLHRSHGWWPTVAAVLATTQLGVPFVILLSRAAKRRTSILAAVALLVFCANLVHVWWLTGPSFDRDGHSSLLSTAVMTAAIGGFWLWLFCWHFRRRVSTTACGLRGGVES